MARRVLPPSDEMARLQDRSTALFVEALNRLILAEADAGARDDALRNLASLLAATEGMADLLGRRRLLLELDARMGRRISPLLYADSAEDSTAPMIPAIPFEEALARIVEADARLVRSAAEVKELYRTDRFFALAYSTDLNVTEKVQKIVMRSIREGTPALTAMQKIEAAGPWTWAYAQTVYRTNLVTAYTAGRFAIARDPVIQDEMPGFRFTAVLDSDTRANHAEADGLYAASNDPIWALMRPPLGYNCILPGTLVSGKIEAASKAFYSGPAVEIQTKNGARLRVTVDHPVLSRDTWKRAGDLEEGDDLVCHLALIESFAPCSGNRPFAEIAISRRTVDDQNMPARIEDVFNAFAIHRARSRIGRMARIRPLDFHGAARFFRGDVDVVGADGILDFHAQSSFDEKLDDACDMIASSPSRSAGHRIGHSTTLLERSRPSSRFPSGGTLTLENRRVVQSRLHDLPLDSFGLGLASRIDAVRNKDASDYIPRDSLFLRDLILAGSGEITSDKIVRIRKFDWSGHVYDLQTEGGWMVANGIVISNCRCTLELADRDEFRAAGMILKNGEIRRARKPAGAGPDPGFRPGVTGR